MSVHINPAPKKMISTARNNALSRCKSADESIGILNLWVKMKVPKLSYSILERITGYDNPDYQVYLIVQKVSNRKVYCSY